MQRAALVTMIVGVHSVAGAEPTQLPKQCVAESPIDEPCKNIAGRYQITLTPREKSCVVRKKTTGVLVVKSEGTTPAFDASSLIKALKLGNRKADKPVLGADIRDGVCCLDLRLYTTKGPRESRIDINLASGATLVSAKAEDRWIDDNNDDCGDEDLDITVQRLAK